MTRLAADAAAKVDHRWLRAGRVVFVPAGVLCLLAIGDWRGAVLWIALSGLYVLAQPRIARLMDRGQARRWAPATLGLLGTTVLSAGPIIAAGSDSAIGPIVGLIMLAAGVQFLIAGYAAAPRLGLLVALPCVLAAAWIVFNLTAVPPQELVIVSLGTVAALLFAGVHTRTALKDRLARAREHALLVAEISNAHDAAVRAEQASASALERLRQSVGVTPAGLAFFEPDGRLSFWNDHLADYCRAYGVELQAGLVFDDILARMEADGSSPRAGRNTADRMNLQLAVDAAGDGIELARFDGRWFRYEYRRLPGGGTSTTIIDITDIKRRENFIRAIFNNNAVPMCVVDPESLQFREANDALVTLFGWDRSELAGMTVHDLVDVSDREPFGIEHRKKILDPDHSANRTWRCRTRDGQELFIQPFSSQVMQSDGKAVLTGALLDFTAKTHAERDLRANTRALRRAKRTAEMANKAKSEFLAMMSHELRTPLNGILGMAQALGTAPLTPAQTEQVDTIVRSGQALTAILNDILDLSKIESGRMDLAIEPVNIRDLVEGSCDLWRLVAEDKGLDLRVEIAPATPDWVAADPLRLRQVILNLLSNAVKFTERGHVLLGLVPDTTRTGVVLTISDTGTGLSTGAQKRLFRKFEQLSAGITRQHGGTGLGLVITRRLAQTMGGDVSVASRLGRGSTFTVTLPLEPVDAPREVAALPEYSLPADLSVLVAEDNAVNQAVIQALLGNLGWRLTVVDDGQKALEALRGDAFDVILMDVHMPVLDGLAAVRAIRAGEAGDIAMPIIALTADAMLGDREQFLASGFDGHVPKPIEATRLFQAIARTISERRETVRPVPDALTG